jgi:hypothetical protein
MPEKQIQFITFFLVSGVVCGVVAGLVGKTRKAIILITDNCLRCFLLVGWKMGLDFFMVEVYLID